VLSYTSTNIFHFLNGNSNNFSALLQNLESSFDLIKVLEQSLVERIIPTQKVLDLTKQLFG